MLSLPGSPAGEGWGVAIIEPVAVAHRLLGTVHAPLLRMRVQRRGGSVHFSHSPILSLTRLVRTCDWTVTRALRLRFLSGRRRRMNLMRSPCRLLTLHLARSSTCQLPVRLMATHRAASQLQRQPHHVLGVAENASREKHKQKHKEN